MRMPIDMFEEAVPDLEADGAVSVDGDATAEMPICISHAYQFTADDFIL